MANRNADHDDVFVALDRAYGLIDGSAAWSDCLEALIQMANVDAVRLMLYDCGRGQSHVVDVAGASIAKERPAQAAGIDDALWRSTPGKVWSPAGDDRPKASGPSIYGYSVLDRDSANILYLELLQSDVAAGTSSVADYLLRTVLPHLHRACRLYRSITGEDLVTFASPNLAQPAPSVALPIEFRLRRRFSLSKAEARVATLLADGLAPRMIAEKLNVSIHTVRSQLQSIFNKTDTSRQAELTSLILRETDVPRAIGDTAGVGVDQSERSACP